MRDQKPHGLDEEAPVLTLRADCSLVASKPAHLSPYLPVAFDLYGEQGEPKKAPRTRRKPPCKQIDLTSYDGRHEWTRRAIRGGSNPIAVTKAGGWKGHSAMVTRYYGELEIVNEDIILER